MISLESSFWTARSIQSGWYLRIDVGRRSDLMSATVWNSLPSGAWSLLWIVCSPRLSSIAALLGPSMVDEEIGMPAKRELEHATTAT